MAQLVIPAGAAQITFVYQLAGDPEPMNNVFGVDWSPVDNAPTTLQNIAASWGGSVMSRLSDTLTLLEVRATIAQDPDPPLSVTEIVDEQGGDSGAVLPQNCAYLLQKRSEHGGPTGRGRMFLPGVPESKVSNTGVVDGVERGIITGAAASFIDDLVDFGTPMLIFHASAEAPYQVVFLPCDGKIATQRERLRR